MRCDEPVLSAHIWTKPTTASYTSKNEQVVCRKRNKFHSQEVHDKNVYPGIARTAELIQRNFDVTNWKQKLLE